MIRPLGGTSPASDVPQQPRKSGKQAQAAVAAASLAADTVKLGKLATPPKTLSLKAKPDTDARDLIEAAKTNVLLITEGIPTTEMVKMLRKAAKDDIKVEVRFHVQAGEPDVTRAFRDAAVAKLRDAGATVIVGHLPAGPEAPPNTKTTSGKLWVDY